MSVSATGSTSPPVCPICMVEVTLEWDGTNADEVVDQHISRGCDSNRPSSSTNTTTRASEGTTDSLSSASSVWQSAQSVAPREPYFSNAVRRTVMVFCFEQLRHQIDEDVQMSLCFGHLPHDIIRYVAKFLPLVHAMLDAASLTLQHKLTDHNAYVWGIAANKSHIVSGGGDNLVKMYTWNGESRHSCSGHTNSVRCVAITDPSQFRAPSNGSHTWTSDAVAVKQLGLERLEQTGCPIRVVSGSDDHDARIWDPVTGVCLAHWRAHDDGPVLACASADLWLVTGSSDRLLKVWTFEGELVRELQGHTGDVYSACVIWLDRIGPRVISGSFDKTARVWDPDSGNCLLVLEGGDQVYGVNANENMIVTGSQDSIIRLYDWDGIPVRTLRGHTRTVRSVCFDGLTQLVSGSWDKDIRIWDITRPEDEECVRTINAHTDWIKIVVSHDEKIASCSDDRSVQIWGPPDIADEDESGTPPQK